MEKEEADGEGIGALEEGERESGRAGERESGRAGERESGRAGERGVGGSGGCERALAARFEKRRAPRRTHTHLQRLEAHLRCSGSDGE